MKKLLIFPLLCVCLFACQAPKTEDTTAQKETAVTPKKQRPLAHKNGKIFQKGSSKYLYGGEKENQHFDISDCSLKDEQFHYGIGRESFPALLAPVFIEMKDVQENYPDSARFLLAKGKTETKAYAIKDLIRHELVNDYLDGKPIFAAYCILADLGAVYDRTYGEKTFTFALSGYTYFDEKVWDGMDGFVMWDRETESLWWPLIGEAVAGPMKGRKMKVLPDSYWSQTNWADIKKNYPEVKILQSGQDFERPTEWIHYETIPEDKTTKHTSVAPRWKS